jgi:prepilin-type processing-associated H-X9-DG protein
MEPDLLGYVLKTLEPGELAQVEAFVHSHPVAQAQVEAMRQTLAPLAFEPSIEPPSGLADRTLAHIAELTGGGTAAAAAKAAAGKLSWPGRRVVELIVAAVCIVTITGLGVAWIARIRGVGTQGRGGELPLVDCQNNLLHLYKPFRTYADLHHGQFPNVSQAQAPRNVVAMVYPMLCEAKLLQPNSMVGNSGMCCSPSNPLDKVSSMDSAAFQKWTEAMKRSYAYSLGYQGNKQIIGPRMDDGIPLSLMPLLADSPPLDPWQGNSPDHDGRGQHVLYADGHVTFCYSRHVGYEQDDIYLNRASRVAAGLDARDAVLASGPVIP